MNSLLTITFIVCFLAFYVDGLSYCQAPLPKFINDTFPKNDNFVLKQVAVYHRHGDRSPLRVLPNERDEAGVEWNCDQQFVFGSNMSGVGDVGLTYASYDKLDNIWAESRSSWRGNCYPGQLTKEGATMTYELGKALRELYVNQLGFLPDKLDPSLVYFRSTGVPRAQQSLFSALQGLYPASKRPNGNSVPFHVVSDDYETILPRSNMCPRIKTLQKVFSRQPGWVQKMKTLKPIMEKIIAITGTSQTQTLNNVEAVTPWFDILFARRCHGMPLPCKGSNCVTEKEADLVADAAMYSMGMALDVNASGTGYEASRLSTGPMLRELLEFMQRMVNGDRTVPRYLHFSGHDTTVIPLVVAMQYRLEEYPPYASALLVELYQSSNTKEYYVRMLFNNKPLVLPDCWSTMCPFSVFKNMIDKHFTIRDVEKECEK